MIATHTLYALDPKMACIQQKVVSV